MNNKCLKCGAIAAENDKYCSECGSALKKSSKRNKTGKPLGKQTKNKKSAASKTNVIYLVALLALVTVAGYNYKYFVQPEELQHVHTQNPGPTNAPSMDQGALQELQSRVRANPDGIQENTELGNFLFDHGRYTEALEHYLKVLSLDPNNTDVIVDAGVCYFNLQRFDEANEFFERAIQTNPNHINANFNLGIVARQLNDFEKAKIQFEKLLKIDENNPNALYQLGVVLAQLGDMQGMRNSWQTLIRVAPNSEPARMARQMMDQVTGTQTN